MQSLITLLKGRGHIFVHEENVKYTMIFSEKLFPIGRCCFKGEHDERSQFVLFSVPLTSKLTLSDWLPSESLNNKDNFCGVNRFYDPIRLSGIKYKQAEGQSFEDFFDRIAQLTHREGSAPNTVIATKSVLDQIKSTVSQLRPKLENYLESYDPNDKSIYLLTLNTWKVIHPENILVCVNPGLNLHATME